MSMAVGIQDSGLSQWAWSGKASGMAFREQCQAKRGGALESELCQGDLPVNLSPGISIMSLKSTQQIVKA